LVVGRCRDDLSSIISNPKIDVDNLKKKKCSYDFSIFHSWDLDVQQGFLKFI
jgi:hypothetical protein